MDSIGGFEPLDPGSIPGISATLNREDEDEQRIQDARRHTELQR